MWSKPISPKAKSIGSEPARGPYPALAYVAPFGTFVALLTIERAIPLAPVTSAVLRIALTLAALTVFSRSVIPRRLSAWVASILLGIAVFVVWIGPDLVWPGYRNLWFFHNALTGAAVSSLPAGARKNAFFIILRVVESVVVIPILEELFWRGWMMRWLIRPNFLSVPAGRYTPVSFWTVALLFAAEHGPYWEVGLIAGIAYNAWMVRTRSLADCMLAHGVTNSLLAAYVLLFNQWQYWL